MIYISTIPDPLIAGRMFYPSPPQTFILKVKYPIVSPLNQPIFPARNINCGVGKLSNDLILLKYISKYYYQNVYFFNILQLSVIIKLLGKSNFEFNNRGGEDVTKSIVLNKVLK